MITVIIRIISTTVGTLILIVLIVTSTAHSGPTAYNAAVILILIIVRLVLGVHLAAHAGVAAGAAGVGRRGVGVVVGGSGVVVHGGGAVEVLLEVRLLLRRILLWRGVVRGRGVGGRVGRGAGGFRRCGGGAELGELVGGARELLHQVHEVVAAGLQDGGGHLLGRALALLLLRGTLGGFGVVEVVHVVAAADACRG